MERIVYVNGEYVQESDAKISVFDRGFLFADGVYEVTSVLEGKLIDFDGHLRRLRRSLVELAMTIPCPDEELLSIHRELVARNAVVEGLVYLQVTRGAADRDFAFPKNVPQTLVLFTQAKSIVDSPLAKRGARVVSVDDLRWGRRDIKTVQLLYPSMAKMIAQEKGADDAWLVQDGLVTEGTSNNAYIVTQDGTIVTRDLSSDILAGITRAAVLKCARELQMKVEERPFSIAEALTAREAFTTSATGFVCPVVEIDGTALSDGNPGAVAVRLRQAYIEESLKAAI
ncbi:D-amino-acid transaminase [Mesorhizobium sp. CGMCC 1.15528]|uniref:Probable branched-chain-amino-acid aminotransferase n=1 Tax=Mesorhizobium zhangyense TaxID=1776730 RepID=A0A7C9V939_9HYPH|nr:D-amino-acid transaminase [Mesorhizobium zhangyense]NGN39610.1 D-amino-acid transaminase [Mesorhizobium zhangyense]